MLLNSLNIFWLPRNLLVVIIDFRALKVVELETPHSVLPQDGKRSSFLEMRCKDKRFPFVSAKSRSFLLFFSTNLVECSGVWVRTCKCITRSSGQKPFGLSIKMKLSLRKRAKPFLFLFQEELKNGSILTFHLSKLKLERCYSSYVSFFNLFQNPFHLFNYCCLLSVLLFPMIQ